MTDFSHCELRGLWMAFCGRSKSDRLFKGTSLSQ